MIKALTPDDFILQGQKAEEIGIRICERFVDQVCLLKRLIAIGGDLLGVVPCTPVVGPFGKDLKFVLNRIEKSFDIFLRLFILQLIERW